MTLKTLGLTILGSLASLHPLSGQAGWTASSPATSPGALRFHQLTFDAARGRTVLFGGWQPTGYFGNTWEWDGVNWTAIATANAPAARGGHAMAYDPTRRRVVLFGGGNQAVTEFDDTWEFDGVNWQQRLPASYPSARRFAAMALDPRSGRLLLFGGGPTPSVQPEFADTWEWDGTDWTQRQPAHSPPARAFHGMATDHVRRTVVLFGGASSQQPAVGGDTWVWDGADWNASTPQHAPLARQRHSMSWNGQSQTVVMNGGNISDVFTWHWDGADWRRDLRAPWFYLISPFAMSYDSLRQRTVVVGEGVGPAAQTWEYAPGALAQWFPGSGACPGTQGSPTLQPAAGSLPVLPSIFTLALSYGSGNAVAGLALGLDRVPQSLAGFGLPGCQLPFRADAVVLMTLSSGAAELAWILPNTTALNGVAVHAKGFVGDPGANPAGVAASASGLMRLGAF